MPKLTEKSCAACRGNAHPLHGQELNDLRRELPEWEVVAEHHLRREFRFPDFVQALAFVNRVGEIAEREGHHPDIELGWGRVAVTTYTHKVNALTESDFILAAKIDAAYSKPA